MQCHYVDDDDDHDDDDDDDGYDDTNDHDDDVQVFYLDVDQLSGLLPARPRPPFKSSSSSILIIMMILVRTSGDVGIR